MGELDPNQPMHDVKPGLSFVPLIDADSTMRDFTQELQSASSRREQQEIEKMREEAHNYHLVLPHRMSVTHEGNCRKKKQFVEAMLKLDRLKSKEEPDARDDNNLVFKDN